VDETALVAGLRAGDSAAYTVVLKVYGGRLLATARRFLRSEDDARDAVQDALISAFKNIASFQGEARVATWLHRIVVNSALMKLRAMKRRDEISIESLLPTYLDDGHRRGPTPSWQARSEDLLCRSELRQQIRSCIDRLPEDYRNVLLLRDIEEVDTAHAATILETTPGAVKVRLHRARMALRELLEREFLNLE